MNKETRRGVLENEIIRAEINRLFELDADIRQRFLLAEKIKQIGAYSRKPF